MTYPNKVGNGQVHRYGKNQLLVNNSLVVAPHASQGGHRTTLTCKKKKKIYAKLKMLNILTWELQKFGFNKN